MWQKALSHCSVALITVLLVAGEGQAAVGRTAGVAQVGSSGSANYVIPITVPAGTNSLTPNLALMYDSQAGDGLFGVGFNLSGLSTIARCNKTIAQDTAASPATLASSDGYCWNGHRLRLTGGSYGSAGSTYQTELETFTRLTAIGTQGNGPQSWEAHTKDGLIYSYGATTDSRIQSTAAGGGVVATARLWAVSSIRDRSGNTIEFSYLNDTTNGSHRPNEIRWTTNAAQGVTVAPYKIVFVYESATRPDPQYGYRFGDQLTVDGRINELRRADSIDVYHNSTIVRRYNVSYDGGGAGGRSRLQSVQECGVGGSECFPATTFTWVNGTSSWNAESSTGQSIPTAAAMLMDINGDGRDDLVYSSSTVSGAGYWHYMLGTSSGFSSAVSSGLPNTSFSAALPIDWGGDGRWDLLVPYSGGTWWVLPSTDAGMGTPLNTGVAWSTNSQWWVADLNGDGRGDLVRGADVISGNATEFKVRYQLSGSFDNEVTHTTLGGWHTFHSLMPSAFGSLTNKFRSSSKQPDFDGDGREDIVVMSKGSTPDPEFPVSEIYINILYGRGVVGPVATYNALPTQPITTWATGDLNGDGLSDLIFVRDNSVKVMRGRGLWPTGATNGPGLSGMTAASLAMSDWDGDGMDDVVVDSSSALMVSRSNGQTLPAFTSTGLATNASSFPSVGDVNGDGLDDLARANSGGVWALRTHQGSFPDLLDRVTDGFGVFADFNYQSTAGGTACYAREGAEPGYPKRRFTWAAYTVCSLETSNGVGGSYTVSYNYYNGNLDQRGRGFLGFERKQTRDNRDNLYLSETYAQDFPYVGFPVYQRLRQPSNITNIQEVTNTLASHSYSSGQRMLPYISQSQVKDYAVEVGGSYNGQLIRTATTTNLVDSGTGTPYDTTTTVVEGATANGLFAGYAHTSRTYHPALFTDTANWCLGRPSTTQQINSHGLPGGAPITRTSSTTWTGPGCRPTSSVVEPGNVQWQVTTTYGYDDFGNLQQALVQPAPGQGQANRLTTIAWQSTGQFPVSVTNPKSHITSFTFDAALGVLTGVTDPNLLTTTTMYDEFGRAERMQRPDGTATDFALSWCNTAPCQGTDSNTRTALAQIERTTSNTEMNRKTTYADLFGRTVRTESTILSGASSTSRTIYDVQGRISQVSAPYLVTDPVWYTTLTYDLVGRPILARRPKHEGDLSNHDTRFSYQGLRTITINARGYSTTRVSNAIGQIVQTIDAQSNDTDYEYDAFGNLLTTRDVMANVIAMTYNVRGMKMTSSDPDLGAWSYNYYPLGEIKSQTDAKNQTTAFNYDLLSRLTSRVEPEGTTTFVWDPANGIGRLSQAFSSATTCTSNNVYCEAHQYDSLGRPNQLTIRADNVDYAYNYSYNATTGFQETMTYPTSSPGFRLKLRYTYDVGHLKSIQNYTGDVISTTLWDAQGMNARGQIILESFGNGLSTSSSYDRITGWLDDRATGPSASTTIQNFSYLWDESGNLTQRYDGRAGTTETFYYDSLERLYESRRNGSVMLNVGYNAIGNITSKTGMGTYTYHATKKHAVTATTTGGSYSYDANGNMESGGGKSITYYSNNLTKKISGGPTISDFWYGPTGARWKHRTTTGSNIGNMTFVGPFLERLVTPATNESRHFVYAPTGPVAFYKRASSGSGPVWSYLTTDHLGSTDVITNWAGAELVNLSFTPFGERKAADGISNPSAAEETAYRNVTRRGFTFHEHLDQQGLIHMNGRLYDPKLGRFTAADPYVQAPYDAQSLNRYSYVLNNPLKYTDPTGYNCAQGAGTCWQDSNSLGGTQYDIETVVVTGSRGNDYPLEILGWFPSGTGGYSPGVTFIEATEGSMIENVDVQGERPEEPDALDEGPVSTVGGTGGASLRSMGWRAEFFGYNPIGRAIAWPFNLAAPFGTWVYDGAQVNPLSGLELSPRAQQDAAVLSIATGPMGLVRSVGARGAAGALQGLGNIGSHGVVDAGTALSAGQKWLAAGYGEIAPGVFRSADGLRQFRMTNADLLATHGNIGSHVHFEALDNLGNVIENLHLPVTP